MIPVVWVSFHPDAKARGMWDQTMVDELLSGRLHRTDHRFVHHEGFGELPSDADGAVVVLPGRFHAEAADIERLNKEIAGLSWLVLIVTSDEESLFPWRAVDHPNMRLWVMTPRPGTHGDCPARFIGEGWPPGTPEMVAEATDGERPLDWFFAGQVTHKRREQLVRHLRELRPHGRLVETHAFADAEGLPRSEYVALLCDAKVAPAPSGPATQDSFRLYEALEAGCVPIADGRTSDGREGYWDLLFGSVPFPVVRSWAQLPGVVEHVLGDWQRLANRSLSWWMGRKREMALWIDADLFDLGLVPEVDTPDDLITVLVATSPIPSHPSTEVIERTVDSVRERLPHAEIVLMVDGVSAADEERRDDYEAYIGRLLHLANTRWRNTLPLVFEAHTHQAEMTRQALAHVRTPLVMFVEHDTPLVHSIDFAGICRAVLSGEADSVRLHYATAIGEYHHHLMPDGVEPRDVDGVPLVRTIQWSQRPHVARAAWYRRVIDDHFAPGEVSMIEDRMHTVAQAVHRASDVNRFRLAIYAPEDNMERSTHTDGRRFGA